MSLCSNPTLFMMYGVIFSFVFTSQASQLSREVDGVRAVTGNGTLFSYGILHA